MGEWLITLRPILLLQKRCGPTSGHDLLPGHEELSLPHQGTCGRGRRRARPATLGEPLAAGTRGRGEAIHHRATRHLRHYLHSGQLGAEDGPSAHLKLVDTRMTPGRRP